jgi:hypothetical protein
VPAGRSAARAASAGSHTAERQKAASALSALQAIILEEKGDCLVADKLLFGHNRDTWVVWSVPRGQKPSHYESALRASISSIRPNYPDAKACVLAASRGGFSRDLLQTLTEERIPFLVPIWFFDAPFKVDEARRPPRP